MLVIRYTNFSSFHFATTEDSNEISKYVTSIIRHAYDSITIFEICRVYENTKMEKSRELNINFSSNEKVINSYMNSYFMANIVFWQR